jgi:phosphoribosylamine-glycine ligase
MGEDAWPVECSQTFHGLLSLGVADRFTRAGRLLFGPSQAATRLESSKAFEKAFRSRRRRVAHPWPRRPNADGTGVPRRNRRDGTLTAGGCVLTVVARGASFEAAIVKQYRLKNED